MMEIGPIASCSRRCFHFSNTEKSSFFSDDRRNPSFSNYSTTMDPLPWRVIRFSASLRSVGPPSFSGHDQLAPCDYVFLKQYFPHLSNSPPRRAGMDAPLIRSPDSSQGLRPDKQCLLSCLDDRAHLFTSGGFVGRITPPLLLTGILISFYGLGRTFFAWNQYPPRLLTPSPDHFLSIDQKAALVLFLKSSGPFEDRAYEPDRIFRVAVPLNSNDLILTTTPRKPKIGPIP